MLFSKCHQTLGKIAMRSPLGTRGERILIF